MKKVIGGIIAILVVVMLVFVAVVVLAGDGIWPTPWEEDNISGAWGQEIIIEYADGTNESLKLGCDKLSIWSGSKEIRGLYYILNAKAEGIGYNSILYDITGFTFTYEASSGSLKNIEQIPCSGYTLAARPVDGEWHQILRHYSSASDIIPTDFSAGDYTVVISSSGNIKYSADGEAQVTVSDLPDTINFTLTVKQDKSISVSFSSGYEVFE